MVTEPLLGWCWLWVPGAWGVSEDRNVGGGEGGSRELAMYMYMYIQAMSRAVEYSVTQATEPIDGVGH